MPLTEPQKGMIDYHLALPSARCGTQKLSERVLYIGAGQTDDMIYEAVS